jgi:hypothetical protein
VIRTSAAGYVGSEQGIRGCWRLEGARVPAVRGRKYWGHTCRTGLGARFALAETGVRRERAPTGCHDLGESVRLV